jgi:molybdopterin/thiamine biosynthesis adenylyltransferase
MPNYFHTQDLIASFEPSLSPEVFDRRLLVVGLGGNGSHVTLAAARMGFSTIVGVDRDVVSESNLSRQVLYTREDVGRPKAEVAAEALGRHNLRSQIETHHLDILAERRRFLGLVAGSDLVLLALDQPSTTFFVAEACFRAHKPAVTGGTCVLSGLATRVWWMGAGQSPCLNCLVPAHPSMSEWVRYFRNDGAETPERTPGVDRIESKMRLEGGHPSIYPSACIGANLMIGIALNILRGRTDMPRGLEMSVLGFVLQGLDLPRRPGCPTCSTEPATA